MFDPTNKQDVEGRAASVSVANPAFAARLAIGVRNKPTNGHTAWAVFLVKSGGASVEEVRTLVSDELPEDELKVVLAISAAATTWSSITDDASFLDAVEEQRFYVTGETPFFIRHLASIVEVLAAFRS